MPHHINSWISTKQLLTTNNTTNFLHYTVDMWLHVSTISVCLLLTTSMPTLQKHQLQNNTAEHTICFMPTYQQICFTYHHTSHKKETALHEDNKQQYQQFLLRNAIYIVFVFQIFIDMHFVTPKTKIPISPHNWCCNCNFGFYVFTWPEDDNVGAWNIRLHSSMMT